MHRRFVLFVTLCLLLTELQAQERMSDTMRYAVGLRAGYAFSNITFQPYQTREAGNGIEMALAFRMAKIPYLGIDFELVYSQTSYKTIEYTARSPKHPVALGESLYARDTWLQIPLLLNLSFDLSLLHIDLLGGGYADFLLTEHLGRNASQLAEQKLYTAIYNRLGVGMEGGGALGIKTSIGNFMLEYRTWYRLTNLYERERIPKRDEPRSNVRNQTIGIAYYYIFH